ncbi:MULTISPECIES: SOUL family heme-binding protein [Micrococcaceae]|uniref:SOUL family heme-binding protein n=1 Tax=Micrococcaceae TaxID=1268 RepID=UPI0006F57134|nr:heme-binding protein [Arthrobacter sp. Soil761]KRE75961.1 heme-binding protein [Arthrobacter sp. Soil761]
MTEQQPFELIRRYPHFELRRYPDYVVAEVTVTADFDRAGNAAFRHLFNYISGSNNARQKLAMTAPVLQEPGPRKLAMTTPVLQSGPVPGSGEPAEYSVAFVLPAGVTADGAPVPADPMVRIRAVPGSLAAVLGFSGSGSASAFQKRNDGLHAALTLAGLTPVGTPRFARFDPPFKPWFLRHNEVVQDVLEPQAGGTAPGA